MTLVAACCLFALVAGAPGETPGFEELPFAFRLDPADAERYRNPGIARGNVGTSIELRLEGAASDARIDVFEAAGSALPRWRWRVAQTARGNRAVVAGNRGVETLIVVRSPSRKDYQIDGPFRWPEEPGRRSISGARFRTVAGTDPILKAGGAIALIGQPSVRDPLCENDRASRWQCVSVPGSFKGVAAACGIRDGAAFVEVSPETGTEVVFRHPAWASAVRLAPEEAVTEGPTRVEMKLVKPGPAGGQILVKEAGFEFLDLGGNLFWILGVSPVVDQTFQVRTGAHVARLSLSTVLAAGTCGEPGTVALEVEQRIFGTVYDKEGKAAPLPFVFVLEETGPTGIQDAVRTRVVSGVDGDGEGRYGFSELSSKAYIVRACQGSLGCSEKRVVPGSEPVDFHLQPRGAFKGRVVSTSGVPEAGATVRIVPTLSQYEGAKDRFRYLPLETRADSEGRFQITAPEIGRFLLEARTHDAGTARREVQVSELSEETDLGDIRLPPLCEFSADVAGCGSGTLELIGPVGDGASVPTTLRFSIEPSGRVILGLPEGGMWLLSATCAGVRRTLDPSILYRAEELVGLHVRFKVVESGPAEKNP